MRTIICGGTVARHNGVIRADVAFEDGRIVEMGENLPREGADSVDAEGCIIMPGGVDVHTHFTLSVDMAGRSVSVSDGMYAGTLAAACGGTTCVVEHPGFGPSGCALTQPPGVVKALGESTAVVDYGIHSVFQPEPDISGIDRAVEMGCVSGKVYMTYSGMLDDMTCVRVLRAMRDARCLTVAHCESDAIVRYLAAEFQATGRTGAHVHPLARPALCEEEAIFRMTALARTVEAPLYVAHLSTAAGLGHISDARRAGATVLAETCPQYLLLDESCYHEGAAEGLKYVMAPALRTARDASALWCGLGDGTVDVVATDHCSFSYADKWDISGGNVFRCPGGVPGVETRVPLLFSEGVLKGRLTLPRFVQVVAETPARIMGLAAKGRLEPGADADVVILDPAVERTLSAATLNQKTDYTPFEGMSVRGWPRHVWLRGQRLVENMEFTGRAGCGRYVHRSL